MFTPYRDGARWITLLARLVFIFAGLSLLGAILLAGYEILRDTVWLRLGLVATTSAGVALRLIRTGQSASLPSPVIPLIVDGIAVVAALTAAFLGSVGLVGLVVALYQLLTMLRIGSATEPGQTAARRLPSQPTKLLVASFFMTIAVGAMFLTFPRATTDNQGADLVDAAFMATSATCVTGLSVLNLSDDAASDQRLQSLTLFGQVIVISLVQVGGLGIMTLSAGLVLLLGGRLGPRSHQALQSSVEDEHRHGLEQSLRMIVQMTVVIEVVGALLLFSRFYPSMDDFGSAAWHSIFVSISAFNNAGFAMFGDNLMSFRGDAVVVLTTAGLIVLGGLGFMVVAALADFKTYKQPVETIWARWAPQVKVVVVFSTLLIFGGAICFYFFDFDHSLAGLTRSEKLLSSLFQSVAFRTGGFHMVDLSQISRVTLIVALILMYIGGSPGSTAGGVKTTTVAIAFFSVRAALLGRDEVEIGDRTIPKPVVYRAIAILLTFTGVWLLGLVSLLVAESDKSLESLLVESMSALCTVGATYGITPWCSTAGKIVLILMMFAGRVGPLSMALAVGEDERGRAAVTLPEGKLMVG